MNDPRDASTIGRPGEGRGSTKKVLNLLDLHTFIVKNDMVHSFYICTVCHAGHI